MSIRGLVALLTLGLCACGAPEGSIDTSGYTESQMRDVEACYRASDRAEDAGISRNLRREELHTCIANAGEPSL